MCIILNEVKEAERIIEKGEVGNKPTATLFLLGKYYRQAENLNKEQTITKLDEFMKLHMKNYNPALWEGTIEGITKKAKQFPLREIQYISITHAELSRISEVKQLKYEKLLFTMLCYAKLYNTLTGNNSGWVNADIHEIYRIARVTVKYKKDKFLYLNDLEAKGLISFSNKNDNLNIKVNFVDMNGASVFQAEDFRELGYEYENYVGAGNFIRCKHCGRLVKKKSSKDFSTKYCRDCAKYIKNEQNKSYYNQLFRKS